MSMLWRLFVLVAVALLPAIAIQTYNEIDLRCSRRIEVRDQALGLARLAAAEQRQTELRLALTCLENFTGQVRGGLATAGWTTRREIMRALVKRIEMADNEVRIVYRVAPVLFVEAPTGGVLQDCPKSQLPFSLFLSVNRKKEADPFFNSL